MILCMYISGLLGAVFLMAPDSPGRIWWLFACVLFTSFAEIRYDKLKKRIASLEEDNKRFSEMWKYQTHINDAVVDITKDETEGYL